MVFYYYIINILYILIVKMTLNPQLLSNGQPVVNLEKGEEIVETNDNTDFTISLEANNP